MIGEHDGTSANWTSVGLIDSYKNSRLYPVSPDIDTASNPPTPNAANDPLLNIFDFSSEEQLNEIINILDNDNDQTPYDVDYYVGMGNNHMQHVARIGTEQGVGRIGRASGFCAPYGLICIDPWGLPATDDFRVVLNLAAGTYHGVYAERA